MNGRGLAAVIAAIVVALVSQHPAAAQENRGPAGLPAYIKVPSDRPPPYRVEPEVLAAGRTTDEILATVPSTDSVIVVSGKVNLGGRNYYSAYPQFRGGSLFDGLKECRKEYWIRPQYKSREQDGYTFFVILKNTERDAACWAQFQSLTTAGVGCARIMVKRSAKDAPVAWDNPASTYANSYDMRTLDLGPLIQK